MHYPCSYSLHSNAESCVTESCLGHFPLPLISQRTLDHHTRHALRPLMWVNLCIWESFKVTSLQVAVGGKAVATALFMTVNRWWLCNVKVAGGVDQVRKETVGHEENGWYSRRDDSSTTKRPFGPQFSQAEQTVSTAGPLGWFSYLSPYWDQKQLSSLPFLIICFIQHIYQHEMLCSNVCKNVRRWHHVGNQIHMSNLTLKLQTQFPALVWKLQFTAAWAPAPCCWNLVQ